MKLTENTGGDTSVQLEAAPKPLSAWATHLGHTIKLMRQLQKMGLREYARFLDLSPATLSRIERGKCCDIDTLVKIHMLTGVPFNTLLGIDINA